MALKKDKPNQFGITADYWKIIRIENIYAAGPGSPAQTIITLAQFVNRKAAKDGAAPLATETVVCDGQGNGAPISDRSYYKHPDPLPEATRATAYAVVKQFPKWSDAVDIIDPDEPA